MAKKLKPECFNIANTNGKAVLFRTDDPAINKFTFTITNLTGEDVVLTGGDPVRPGDAMGAGAGSTFNFDFESMLTAEVMRGLKLTLPDDWKAEFFEGNDAIPDSWSIAPQKNGVLAPNAYLQFGIENIICSTTRPGNFEIMYLNIPGYPDTLFPVSIHLSVVNPPDPAKKTLPLVGGYANVVHPIQGQPVAEPEYMEIIDLADAGEIVPIYITYDSGALIRNGFTYILTNTSKDPLVPPTEGDTIENPPVLYFSFLFGDEDYAITTQSLADNNIAINVNARLPWTPLRHIAGTAYWQFEPQSREVLEGFGSVQFPIRNIITPLNAAPENISVLFIQLNNIPGYNDAAYALQMRKLVATAFMEELEADKYTISYGEDVRLTWVSSLAKRVTIDYKTRDGKVILLDSAQGDIKLDGTDFLLPVKPSAEHTIIRASAYDNSPKPYTREITINVIQPRADIVFFNADTQLVNVSAHADVVFTWQVDNARKITILTPEGEKDVTDEPDFTYPLQKTFQFILNAYSYGSEFPAPVQSLLRVYAYKPDEPIPLQYDINRLETDTPILINKPYERIYVVNSNAVISEIDIRTDKVVKTYEGIAMALSANGEKFFVSNSDNGKLTVIMYDVASGAASPTYHLNIYVNNLIVSPDLTRLYCAHGLYNLIQRVDIDAASNTLTVQQTITVGNCPGAMAFNNDATKLFVGNFLSSTVTVISPSDGSVITTLDVKGQPVAFAAKGSANKLYLARIDKTCLVMDTNSYATREIPGILEGAAYLLLSPNGKYLYVASSKTNTIFVVDTDTDLVTGSFLVEGGPAPMALNSDGNVLFVGGYCERTLAVVDLNNGVVLPQRLPTGLGNGSPSGIIVYAGSNNYTRVYIAKGVQMHGTRCPTIIIDFKGLNVSVFSIQNP